MGGVDGRCGVGWQGLGVGGEDVTNFLSSSLSRVRFYLSSAEYICEPSVLTI
jgi:hypothetical protein